MAKKDELTPKQRLFAFEYMVDLNGKQAAIRAGYAERSAEMQASRLLSNAKVKAFVNKLKEKREKKLEISAESVMQELAKMAYANMDDYTKVVDGVRILDLEKLDRVQLAAVQELQTEVVTGSDGKKTVKTKMKLADKKSNLELLGRHLKLFTDVVQHDLKKPLEINIIRREPTK